MKFMAICLYLVFLFCLGMAVFVWIDDANDVIVGARYFWTGLFLFLAGMVYLRAVEFWKEPR